MASKTLFEFENFGSSGNINQLEGAPRLVIPGTSSANQSSESKQYLSNGSKSFFSINVVQDFQWTTSPPAPPSTEKEKKPGGRQEVPIISFREKRLKTNALLAQAAYYSATFATVATDSVNKLQGLPDNIKNAVGAIAGGVFGGNAINQIVQGATGVNLGILGNLIGGAAGIGVVNSEAAAQAADFAGGQFNAAFQDIDNLSPEFRNALEVPSLNSSVLRPYEGLYLTEDTKFLYSFPYLENAPNYVENLFGDTDDAFFGKVPGVPSPGQLMRDFRTTTQSIAALTNITQPGVYIEKPKFFQFNDKGEEIDFTFPLINTGHSKWQDVLNNWQLLFMLIYQNRPNRRSRDLIDPPCIYEVTIPGVKYMPYAYISNLSIDFLGNRRQTEIQIPYLNGSKIKINTIIPDAYMVNITVTGLVSEAQNMLYSMLTDKQNLVSTTETGNTLFGSFISNAASQGRNRNISNSLDGGSTPTIQRNFNTTPGTSP